jgi:hypothetical protein
MRLILINFYRPLVNVPLLNQQHRNLKRQQIRAPMEEKKFNCEHCSFRAKAERKPNSLAARFWRWHTRWCPGWKAYQAHLDSL